MPSKKGKKFSFVGFGSSRATVWRRRNFEVDCPPSLGFTCSSKKKMKLGGVFKKISRRRKKRKRLEFDVLESRSKVRDPNLICVYILIWLYCCLVVTSNEKQFM